MQDFDRGDCSRRRSFGLERVRAVSGRSNSSCRFPAGGGGDVLTRMVAEKWAQAHGIATVIENRPGAATVLGVEAASRAAPDGNTLGIVANSFIIHPNFKKLSYDPLTSFEPICLLANSPQVIVVNSSSPYKTLSEWLDAARAKPGELSHASVGPASPQHIAFEQLKLMAKASITFVPFNGNTPALNALLGGHVGSVMSNYSEAAELVGAASCARLPWPAASELTAGRTCRPSPNRASRAMRSRRGTDWSRRPRRRRTRSPSCRNGARRRCWRRSSNRNGTCRA